MPEPTDSTPRNTETTRSLRVIAITSGKGGVGKTHLTVNLAVAWAQAGRRVLVIDGDVGLANVDVLLDETPEYTLRHLLRGEQPLERVLVESAYGVTLLPGSSGFADMADLTQAQRLQLLDAVEGLEGRFDTVLVDTPAGIGGNALFFAGAAEEVLVVVTPEPTSQVDAYGAIKALVRRCGVRRVGLVVNQATSKDDVRDTFERLSSISGRFLPVTLDLAGSVPADAHVREAAMVQRPVVTQYPAAPASVAVRELSDRLLMRPAPGDAAGRLQFFWRRLVDRPERPAPGPDAGQAG